MIGDVRRCSASVGLAGGVAAAVAGIVGAPMAHADGTSDLSSIDVLVPSLGAESDAVTPIITTYPQELLNDAANNLGSANELLSAGPSDIPGMMQQLDAQNIALSEVVSLSTEESSLSSYDNGAFADLLNPWFNSVDQGFDQATAALLSADKAVETAAAAGSGVDAAVLGVFGADFQLAGEMFNALPIDLAAEFTTFGL
jgi:hypothetical protein